MIRHSWRAGARVGTLLALAGVAFAFQQLTFIIALHETSVVDVTLMNTLAPIVVAVLAVPMFDERPTELGRAFEQAESIHAQHLSVFEYDPQCARWVCRFPERTD